MSNIMSELIQARIAQASDPNSKLEASIGQQLVSEMDAQSNAMRAHTASTIAQVKQSLYDSPHHEKMTKIQDILDQLAERLVK